LLCCCAEIRAAVSAAAWARGRNTCSRAKGGDVMSVGSACRPCTRARKRQVRAKKRKHTQRLRHLYRIHREQLGKELVRHLGRHKGVPHAQQCGVLIIHARTRTRYVVGTLCFLSANRASHTVADAVLANCTSASLFCGPYRAFPKKTVEHDARVAQKAQVVKAATNGSVSG
jgi:hypothetical protein